MAIPTLKGAGTILDVEVVGLQVQVTTATGLYTSQDGFIYRRTG